MIVKKMPILQGFPDFETVKKLTKKHFQSILYRFSMTLKQQDYHEIPLFCILSVLWLMKKKTGRCTSG